VVIEDAEAGVEAARRGGMAVVAISRGTPAPGLAAADLIVADLSGVSSAVLSRLLTARRPARS
jgi:beta-phosphoglucomutase-like phosphatase (HAD superfamily)